MKDVLIAHDEDARGNRINTFRMPGGGQKISVRDLIKNRVESEVERFNTQRPVCFYTLVQPEAAEITSRGYRLKEHRTLDSAIQLKTALEGFDKKCFLINANGRDYQALDDEIDIGDNTEIVFVKFMEVVGG